MSIRCTPFCGPCGKTYKHSDLLVALLNTKDHDKNFFSLSSEIRKLEKGGWNRNDEIPEVNRKYQFPLIHWACVLGKTNAVRWLLDQGFSPTVQKSSTLETCLHRTLMTIPDTVSMKSGRLCVSRFDAILSQLSDCLLIGDYLQNTPLHLAAQFMEQNKCYSLYENLFLTMLTHVKRMPSANRRKCLNARNCAGDTVLNILSSNGKCMNIIEKLLDAGADCMIVNKLSIGPLATAEKCNSALANFLRSTILKKAGYPLPTPVDCSEESRRKSERRSNQFTSSVLPDISGEVEFTNLPSASSELSNSSNGSEKTKNSTSSLEEDPIHVDSGDETISHVNEEFISTPAPTADQDADLIPTAVVAPNSLHNTSTVESGSPPNSFEAIEDEREATENNEETLDTKREGENLEFEEMCRCSEEPDNDGLSNNSSTNNTEQEDNSSIANDTPAKEGPEDGQGTQVSLMDSLKEAGVLQNLTSVIENTKKGHVDRINELKTSLSDVASNHSIEKEKQKKIKYEMRKKKREMDNLKKELANSIKRENFGQSKRKRLVEEKDDLEKKLARCENLLKEVPKNDFQL